MRLAPQAAGGDAAQPPEHLRHPEAVREGEGGAQRQHLLPAQVDRVHREPHPGAEPEADHPQRQHPAAAEAVRRAGPDTSGAGDLCRVRLGGREEEGFFAGVPPGRFSSIKFY